VRGPSSFRIALATEPIGTNRTTGPTAAASERPQASGARGEPQRSCRAVPVGPCAYRTYPPMMYGVACARFACLFVCLFVCST
jgi:hypothetical protein